MQNRGCSIKKEAAAAKDAVEKPKRGRPRKAKTEELTEAAKTEKPTRSRRVKKEAAEEVPAEKPKRGRPRKVKNKNQKRRQKRGSRGTNRKIQREAVREKAS